MEIIGHSNGARRSERGGQGQDGDRGANHSREGRRGGTLNERDRGDRTNSGNSQQKDFRAKSYQQSKKILGSFLNNKQQISRSADAAAFINTIFNLNPVDSVVQVTKDCTRLSIFKTAICSLDGPHIQLVFRLLNYLATMTATFARCAEQCCAEIYNSGILGRSISVETLPGHNDISPLAYLLSTLLLKVDQARADPAILGLASLLKEVPAGHALRSLMCPHELKAADAGTAHRTDPLHDNDYPYDYRSISILPTVEELLSGHTRVEKYGIRHIDAAGVSRLGQLLDSSVFFVKIWSSHCARS
jgi:hypothetical protein